MCGGHSARKARALRPRTRRDRDRDARAAVTAAAPASAALTGTDAVAKTNQVEIFAGRTVARSEDALLRPQEGMKSDTLNYNNSFVLKPNALVTGGGVAGKSECNHSSAC
ncbi:unnamed protein product [Euphydryas editha]|uniref:Uncharacterized protein n=1 Tax=Euphydryas editha TaxID=104508 RepID=A0AAU9V6Z3_EUPED|nr:unnamed protein product [Euphydryas editha]